MQGYQHTRTPQLRMLTHFEVVAAGCALGLMFEQWPDLASGHLSHPLARSCRPFTLQVVSLQQQAA